MFEGGADHKENEHDHQNIDQRNDDDRGGAASLSPGELHGSSRVFGVLLLGGVLSAQKLVGEIFQFHSQGLYLAIVAAPSSEGGDGNDQAHERGAQGDADAGGEEGGVIASGTAHALE